ncbi:MAG: DUF1565 domain-containing protein [Candidatus Bathyarchaeota archaeon]|nr:DUF1565 domain-containing protein [Candidatus Bathyarchaeota archaeon]
MSRTAFALTLIVLLSAATATRYPVAAVAQPFEAITIKADGSITPETAPITQNGNVYTLTSDIWGSITVEKFNIVIDGAGYTLQGNGTWRGIQIFNPYNVTVRRSYDVTVKNFNIKGFEEGIDVFGYWGNIISGVVISGNNVTNNSVGIRFSSYERYSNNTIIGNRVLGNNRGIVMEMGHVGDESGNIVYANQIADNQVGMWFLWLGDYYGWKPNPFEMKNRIYCNNFVNNHQNVVNAHVIYDPDCANVWDNDAVGNFWSDYDGIDGDNNGIGDTKYTIDSNNIDRYPLMVPVDISQKALDFPTAPATPTPIPTPTATPNSLPTPSVQPSQLPSSSPQETESDTNPFQTTIALIASLIAVVTASGGLLVYLKKRHSRTETAR